MIVFPSFWGWGCCCFGAVCFQFVVVWACLFGFLFVWQVWFVLGWFVVLFGVLFVCLFVCGGLFVLFLFQGVFYFFYLDGWLVGFCLFVLEVWGCCVFLFVSLFFVVVFEGVGGRAVVCLLACLLFIPIDRTRDASSVRSHLKSPKDMLTLNQQLCTLVFHCSRGLAADGPNIVTRHIR